MRPSIKLLPDHLANQIAAGEVIQRPASVVKELVENAIDAQATDIQIVIEDAGKRLIQVVDNGHGMNPFNLRMCFERHATSKINQIEDLFSIKTKGFRGEALASIAAVAQVDVKSKTEEDEVGLNLFLEQSSVVEEQIVPMNRGTSFSIKNLFYNVPARRKFLKSTNVEFKHIVEEFFKIALAHPNIRFRLFHNDKEQYHVKAGSHKNRIVSLLGSRYEANLIPVEEETDLVTIKGFIGGPKAAIKSRGNQYFFVNNRFIRSPYLHHAVMKAFEDIIEKDAFPFYVLYLELNAEKVDVNVHPTKQEVKFEDESLLYAYLHAAIKHSLAKFNIAPSLDFHLNPEMEQMAGLSQPMTSDDENNVNHGYLAQSFSQKGQSHFIRPSNDRAQWEQQKKQLNLSSNYTDNLPSNPFFTQMPHALPEETISHTPLKEVQNPLEDEWSDHPTYNTNFLHWEPYMVTTVKSGMLLLHINRALESILYDRLLKAQETGKVLTQQLLFPVDISIDPQDQPIVEGAKNALIQLGYDLNKSEEGYYHLNAVPVDLPSGREQEVIDDIIDQLKMDQTILEDKHRQQFFKKYVATIAKFKKLNKQELTTLIDDLFASTHVHYTPLGRPIYKILSQQQLKAILSNE